MESGQTSTSKWHRIFVYGTLKTGEPNKWHLNEEQNGKAKLLAAAETVSKYPLVVATKFNIPFLLAAEGTGHVSRQSVIYQKFKLIAQIFIQHIMEQLLFDYTCR